MSGKLADTVRSVRQAVYERQPRRLRQRTKDPRYVLVLMSFIINRHRTFISLIGDKYKLR